MFQSLLLQRGGNWFAEDGSLIMDDDLVLDTLLWYTRLAYGPGRIADGAAPFPNAAFYQAVNTGYYVCFVCTDWLTKNIEDNMPSLSGELKLMPMPAWEPGGRRTSTWGATMLAVTTAGENEDLAWELAEYLYVSGDIAEKTFTQMNIISPFRSTWDDPVFREPRAFWSGQRIGDVLLGLADEVPTLRNGPFLPMVQQKIVDVTSACAEYYRRHGEDGFETSRGGSCTRRPSTSGTRCGGTPSRTAYGVGTERWMQGAAGQTVRRTVGRRGATRPRVAPYGFVAPFLVLFAVFGFLPLLQSVYLAFHITSGPRSMVYVGLDNFTFLLHDPDFHTAVRNTVVLPSRRC